MIAILEDDERRYSAMQELLTTEFPGQQFIHFDNSPDMITWLDKHLPKARLLCLDHDLGPNRERDGAVFDPGTGRDVVDFLAQQAPVCPVLIHTSNYRAAPGMEFALEPSGWVVERVSPSYDIAWIPAAWIRAVRQLLLPV